MTDTTTMNPLLIQPDAMVAPTTWPPADGLALDVGYELDPFQKHAVLGIHAADHVFVTAKTGSGKTLVGEYLIARALKAGGRVFYTTPIKSLSNQKYHDLKHRFPEATVGILTGDIKMQPDAQIVVMTAEILRNLFYKRGTATEGVGTTAAVSLAGVVGVVMDEVHYIQDPDRGHVWEESLILCPRDIQLVLLSATMPSAASLAGWLATLHGRRTWLLATTYRIVPLTHGLLVADASQSTKNVVRPLLDPAGRWIGDAYTGWLRERKAIEDAAAAHRKAVELRRRDGYTAPPPSAKVRVEDPMARLRRTVNWLTLTENTPALFFVFSRRECERLAGQVEANLLDATDGGAVGRIMDFHLSRHRAALEKSPQYHRLRELLVRGLAFHHSGLQPLLKEIVEILFARGYVKVLFATETFSVGLNMPTKTVVFLELEKWSDGGVKRLLRPDEYIQMAGRAGRRGIDTEGLVLYQPLREPVDALDIKELLTGALPALQSRMRFHYDFILKQRLSDSNTNIVDKSYWAVQQRTTRAALGHEVGELNKQLAELEERLSLDERTVLAECEELESRVASTVNAARKKAQLALNRWREEYNSPKWTSLMRLYKTWTAARLRRDLLVADCAAWDEAPLLSIGPQEECLRHWDYISSSDDALTPLGLAATEVNEGHSLLLPLLAASGRCTGMSAGEVVCVLAAFLREGTDESAPALEEVGVSDTVVSVLEWLDGIAREHQDDEDRVRVFSPAGFWNLSARWVGVVAKWLSGASVAIIAAEVGLFEGNVIRAILRVANIVEEWLAVATLRSDLATLETFSEFRLLRDEIVADSLYLRLD
jgi:superfamily II RNA helicase